ncbi:cytochrome-c oxidase subunit VIIa [Rhodotorula diobovata]|uniref:Cytochrome-c oxidase subunit VIIa n=1 Tax=Rhodotorula diobovata TaxID=5288 RepID=A0A5C5G0Q6_9BASI|nr:cytochrome-c oxidase subunit VIIa [Rhodotorula diobovata]
MAIAPIQGSLRRSALLHISAGLGSGLLGGYAFWHLHHLRNVRIRDEWYNKQREAQA